MKSGSPGSSHSVLAALLVILVLGIGLPALAFFGSRWRTRRGKDPDHDTIDRWLMDEYQLDWRDRGQVRKAVLGAQASMDLEPAKLEQLRPALYSPAHGLARQVLAGELSGPRVPRPLGWFMLVFAVAYTGLGVATLTLDGRNQANGVLYVVFGCADIVVVVTTVLLAPRRARRRAERVLQVTGTMPAPGELPRRGS